MQNFLAARMMVTLHVLKARYTDRERGASALEYVGMVILAALLVVAIISAINPANIRSTVSDKVNEILTAS
ncbi:hypothetical protein [Branchiibius sp. NY16-3462-2]|uniref:hypothetical protein n=1 Tax=Branchiibius sp. NY16-3462-2 TaxID=1807500 RepID=UPI000792C003|nr:hypothetical protein [Branchiibius sp. NY16-3462-2]KYH45604.1 hypothetical protein AZH51_17945 [Branchiibius sp. NY16-3462-2]